MIIFKNQIDSCRILHERGVFMEYLYYYLDMLVLVVLWAHGRHWCYYCHGLVLNSHHQAF